MAPDLRRLRARSFATWRWVIRDAPRQAYLAITSLLILGALVIGGVIFFSASGQDNIARQKSTDLARAVIEARQRDLAKTNHDYSWWADAVQNLVDKPDAGWAGDNIGQPLFDTFGITGAFVYDAANRAVFAFQNGAPVKIDPMGEAKAGLDKLLAAARANPGEESVATDRHPDVPGPAPTRLGGNDQLHRIPRRAGRAARYRMCWCSCGRSIPIISKESPPTTV